MWSPSNQQNLPQGMRVYISGLLIQAYSPYLGIHPQGQTAVIANSKGLPKKSSIAARVSVAGEKSVFTHLVIK